MTTELVSRRTVVISWRLTSLCLRYGFAKPSVWLCRKACKPRPGNGFRSDYPLNLACVGFGYGGVLEKWDGHTLLGLRSEGRRSPRKVSQSSSQSPGNIAGYTGNTLAARLLIRNHWRSSPARGRPLPAAFASEYAGRLLSPRPLRVAARKRCLDLYRESWLNMNTVAYFTRSQVGHRGPDYRLACSDNSSRSKAHDRCASRCRRSNPAR